MTKADLLTQIESNSLGVVSESIQEEGTLKNGTTYKKYNLNVLVQDGESPNFKNIPFTVLDEGGQNENAFFTQGYKSPQLAVARQAIDAYVSGLSNVIRYEIQSVNEETKDARVSVVENNGNGTATQKTYLVYKNGANPITHVELT